MKSNVIITALLLCVAGVALGQTPAGTETSQIKPVSPPSNTEERYRIGYQDTLDIQVFRHPELTRRSKVNPDGTINLFRLNEPIMAVCKTENELAADIAKAYEKDYLRNPEVSVTAAERQSQAVYVTGAVSKGGTFFMDKRVQLLTLLAFAGGPDIQNVGSRVIVFRPGSTSICRLGQNDPAKPNEPQLLSLKLREVQEGKATLWMEPGDAVYVAPADQVFVYGNVNEQGAVKMNEAMTLTQAIVLAKGLKPATDMDSIRVVRQKPGTSEVTETVYNFKDISKGKAPDPFLEPNDIVAISKDKTQSIISNIGKSLTNGLPSIFYRFP
jgi:polysaccharide export outer membrane protein